MRKIKRISLLKQNRKIWYNYYWQIWFRYHTVFFGSLIFNGKKLKAFDIFLKIKQGLKLKESFDPYLIFLVAMMKVTPDIVFLPVKLGGSSQGVPMPISEKKRIVFGVKWVLKLLKDKHKFLTVPLIVDSLISTIYDKGVSLEKKRSIYKLGSQNRHLLKFFK